ncbi:MAG: hypothetical protein BECKG1743E_GA0114224_101447, partial [Candidatus Kentron sp. G]
NCAGFSFGFKARGRRIVHYVTVIATQKLDDKDKQVGIFFDRNRLSFFLSKNIPACLSLSSSFYVATMAPRYGTQSDFCLYLFESIQNQIARAAMMRVPARSTSMSVCSNNSSTDCSAKSSRVTIPRLAKI